MLEQDYISKIKDEKIKKPMLKISNFLSHILVMTMMMNQKFSLKKIIFMNIIRGWKK